MRPVAGLSWMRTPSFAAGATAAWEREVIGALEVTLEHAFRGVEGPDRALFQAASDAGYLLGHGVHYSLLSHTSGRLERDWLDRVAALAETWSFRWVTEHFGIVRAGGIHAAPLSLPYTRSTLDTGRDRLAALKDAVGAPVGLENLAFAWSADDARRQADFVDALLEPVDGMMVLDLHNLWCQVVNFGFDPIEHLERWPLDRVRQIHISGGSWSTWPEGTFRRDTHDGPVPGEVWALLPDAMARCAGLEVVTLERLGPAIEQDRAGWEWEIDALSTAVTRSVSQVVPARPSRSEPQVGDPSHDWDRIYARAGSPAESIRAAGRHWLAAADPRAVRTAALLLEKWGRPVPGS